MSSSLEDLPLEIIAKICAFLPPSDLLSTELVSKSLQKACKCGWTSIKEIEFPNLPKNCEHGGKNVPEKFFSVCWSHCGGTVERVVLRPAVLNEEELLDRPDILSELAASKIKPIALRRLIVCLPVISSEAFLALRELLKESKLLEELKLQKFPDSFADQMTNDQMLEISSTLAKVLTNSESLKRLQVNISRELLPSAYLSAVPFSTQEVILNYSPLTPWFAYKNHDTLKTLDYSISSFLNSDCPRTQMRSLRMTFGPDEIYAGVTLGNLVSTFPNLAYLSLVGLQDGIFQDWEALAELSLQLLNLDLAFTESNSSGVTDQSESGEPSNQSHSAFKRAILEWTKPTSRMKTSLKRLLLNRCCGPSSSDWRLISGFPNLRELSLMGAGLLTSPEALIHIIRHAPDLEIFRIDQSEDFDDRCLEALGDSCPNLNVLSMRHCVGPSNAGVAKLESLLFPLNHHRRPLKVSCRGGRIEAFNSDHILWDLHSPSKY